MTKESLWKQNGLPLMVNIMQNSLAKYQTMRRASHQPVIKGSYLNISHMCLSCYELVLVFLVLLKEVRTLRRRKPKMTQGVVSLPSYFPQAGW